MARSVSDLGPHLDRKFGVIGRQPARCDTHGEYSAVMLRAGGVSGCPICASDKRDMEELERKRFQFRTLQHESAKIPKRFADKSFASFVASLPAQQVALDACIEYVDNFSKHKREGRCMLLLGKVGTGKTHLACAILQCIVRNHGFSGLIVTAESITQAVTDSFRNNSGPTKTDLINELASVDLLVIDEVGVHSVRPGKDFTPSLLHETIDRRYQLVKPTILVSNQKPEDLHSFIGPRAADRLRENGGLLAPFTWKSARSGGSA